MSKNIIGLTNGKVLSADYVVDENGTKIITAMLNLVYPIGSIYMSVNDVDPSVLFGGKWEKLEDKFLLGSGSKALGSSGGEENHTLSEAEMPSHKHFTAKSGIVSAGNAWYFEKYSTYQSEDSITPGRYWNADTLPAGSSQPHNNMPPYLTVNMWKRIE